MAGIVQQSLDWVHLVGPGSGEHLSDLRVYGLCSSSTHCARRPSCVIVIMILSENCVEITSVGTRSIMLAFRLVMTGYVGRVLGIWGDNCMLVAESFSPPRGTLTQDGPKWSDNGYINDGCHLSSFTVPTSMPRDPIR